MSDKKVAIVLLFRMFEGGITTHAVEMDKLLKNHGYKSFIIKIGNMVTRKPRTLKNRNWHYNIATVEYVKELKKLGYHIIVLRANLKEYYNETKEILASGASGCLVGCTTEDERLYDLFRKYKSDLFYFKHSTRHKEAKNFPDNKLLFTSMSIPDSDGVHSCLSKNKPKFAIQHSRISNTKGIDIVTKYNEENPTKVIDIYGDENRIYTHYSLDKKFPNWRDNYYGKFQEKTPYYILKPYRFCIDLNVSHEHGGGFEYCIVEGIRSGCVMVLHKNWESSLGSFFMNGHNCLAIENADELKDVLTGYSNKSLDRIAHNALNTLKDVSEVANGNFFKYINKVTR